MHSIFNHTTKKHYPKPSRIIYFGGFQEPGTSNWRKPEAQTFSFGALLILGVVVGFCGLLGGQIDTEQAEELLSVGSGKVLLHQRLEHTPGKNNTHRQ